MMNTNPKNEGVIADNEGAIADYERIKARIPELICKRLLIT